MTSTRLLIVGPQGSGKGTQGARIAEAFGIPVVSTGDIFRANIKEGTDLGLQVKAITDAGDLVPDEVTFAIVKDRLEQTDAAEGFLLDGFPRNVAQVALLDEFLTGRDEALDAVIELNVPREESLKRIALRAQEQGRADDTEAAIAHRLDIYERETAPILAVYRTREVVDTIDGTGELDEITDRIVAALEARGLVRVAAA
ncbi:adenylate kinase [Microbacterium rhizophilus]|uniref:adenylate kinase n=1 Tax=Microbacterium rhizophilus TaxID=3138934 RepID=UPI0031E896B2